MIYDKQRIANRIKSLRIDLGMSQEELAETSGVNLRTIQSYEQGKAIMGMDSASKLADTLNCSLDRLICRTN